MTTGKPDIEIRWDEDDVHRASDYKPEKRTCNKFFDGRPQEGDSNQLAHAFGPVNGGDIHFDDQDLFTLDPTSNEEKEDLFQVMVHEIGRGK